MKKSKLFIRLTGLLACILATAGLATAQPEVVLVFDQNGAEAQIARKFRIDPQLHASASGQFSADELPKILNTIPVARDNIWIIDLRRESHGFIDGLPVSWYSERNAANKDKSAAEIERTEKKLLQEIGKQKTITVFTVKKLADGKITAENPVTMLPELVETEQELVQSLDAQYARIHVLDHFKPADAEIDDFVNFIKYKVKDDAWLHFHCRGGAGRSSTFFAMYAMLRNAQDTSFAEIMQQQAETGNKKLDAIPILPEKMWKASGVKDRYSFLHKFYLYARDPQGYKMHSWTEWQKLQHSK